MNQSDMTQQEDIVISTQAIVELTEANVSSVEADAWQDEVAFLREESVDSDAPQAEILDEVIDLSMLLA